VADLLESLGTLARQTSFSGAVRIDEALHSPITAVFGWANRAHQLPVTASTRFGIASGTKGLTALVVMQLVEDGVLSLTTPIRSLLGSDLPMIDDQVTVEHLLTHRSGIGDYLDEEQLGRVPRILGVGVERISGCIPVMI
jgi:CubicO group peptidase (beta-lactamase class C family)